MKTPCTLENCNRPQQAKGYCKSHYLQYWRTGSPHHVPKIINQCSIEGCTGKYKAKGYCHRHYLYQWVNGYPERTTYTTCTVEGCANDTRSITSPHCEMHYYRMRRNGTMDVAPIKGWSITSNGYIAVIANGHPLARKDGRVLQHRKVLYDTIGSGQHPCNWCGVTVSWSKSYPQHKDALVVDHVDDNKQNNTPQNLVPSCFRCNLDRAKQAA